MIHGHGGNIYAAARSLGCRPDEILDLSSNFNPLGPPPGLMETLRSNLTGIHRLPEVDGADLGAQYARLHGRSPAEVLVGGGTTQFIYQLPRALKSKGALICAPTYADYQDACIQSGVPVSFVLARAGEDFRHDPQAVSAAAARADLLFICNPNNPTGGLWSREEILRLARAHPGTWIVVDESYLPMAPRGERISLISGAAGLPANLIVLDSCSKIHRIPGLRLGFLAAAENVVNRLRDLLLPWSVGSLAQAAGLFLVRNRKELERFVERSRSFLEGEREYVRGALAALEGLRVFPSPTSYLLLELPVSHTSEQVCERMLTERILIRDCANFKGLSQRYVRVSLKDRPANQRFVAALGRALDAPAPEARVS